MVCPHGAEAQSLVVATCGTAPTTPALGNPYPLTIDQTGKLCVNATVSATITFPTIGAAVPATADYVAVNVAGNLRGLSGVSTGSIFPAAVAVVDASGNQITSFGGSGSGGGGGGFAHPFQPNGNFAILTATNASASVALPAGTTVLFQNTGTTTVSCTLGVGSATATASEIIVPANSGVPAIVGSNTFGACIDQTGSTSNVVVLAGGAVLETSILTAVQGSIPAGSALIGGTNPTPSSSSSLALTDVVCGSASSSCVLKASAGNLYGVYAECTAACWLMVFNSTIAPTNGATTAGKASGNLVECISLTGTAGGGKSLNYPTFPIAYSVGITVAISSTACSNLTLSTVGFVHGTVL